MPWALPKRSGSTPQFVWRASSLSRPACLKPKAKPSKKSRVSGSKYDGMRFVELIRHLQPATLVNDRIGVPGDHETPEQFIPKGFRINAQSWLTAENSDRTPQCPRRQ